METDFLSHTEQRNVYRSRLIELVRANPILWNKKSTDFTHREVKTQKWLEVSEKLGVSTDRIRRTWENLRDQYRRDLKRTLATGTRSQWRFFDDMDFIRTMVRIKGSEYRSKSGSESEYEESEQRLATNFIPIQLTTEWKQLAELQQLQQNEHEPQQPHFEQEEGEKLEQQHCDSSEILFHDQKFNGIELLDVENVIKVEVGSEANDELRARLLQSYPIQELIQQQPGEPQPQQPMPTTDTNTSLSEQCVSTSGGRSQRRCSTADPLQPSDFKRSCQRQDVDLQDEDYHFVMSILPSLRQVARPRKFPLRSQIMTLISKELGEMND